MINSHIVKSNTILSDFVMDTFCNDPVGHLLHFLMFVLIVFLYFLQVFYDLLRLIIQSSKWFPRLEIVLLLEEVAKVAYQILYIGP